MSEQTPRRDQPPATHDSDKSADEPVAVPMAQTTPQHVNEKIRQAQDATEARVPPSDEP